MSPAAALGSAARLDPAGPSGAGAVGLRAVAGGRPCAPRRAPFVVLVLLLLGVGLVGLLVLSTALQQGSFELADLERETDPAARPASRSSSDEVARRVGSGHVGPASAT